MHSRILGALMAVAMIASTPVAVLAQSTASVSGRVLDVSQGLPVPGAQVELDRGAQKIATTTTDANGVFTFPGQPAGEYSLLIVARGYATTQVPAVALVEGTRTDLQTAIQPLNTSSAGDLKEIGRVAVASRAAMQTSATINRYVDPSDVQTFGYARIGDVLGKLPGVSVGTSSSVGDDASISIRGFNSSETSALLDGHPIGPIGAQGGGFNLKLSPFWGLSGTSVIYGSGAAGIYGASTIAGAVDFQTLNPTREPHASLQQGIGDDEHMLTGFDYTGSLGKFGYALAGASQGTQGQFSPQVITQNALLSASVNYTDPNGNTPPDITKANIDNPANTYLMSGSYTQRNGLAKFTYAPSDKTQLLVAAFDAATWNDKTGEGDNDFLPYGFQLANAPVGNDFTLPSGSMTNCGANAVAVLNDSAQGFQCDTPQQYANTFSGPFGGGIGRWNASHLQDYHARVTQQLGKTTFLVDGFVDNTFSDEHKSPTGPFFDDRYTTHGLLLSDEFLAGQNNDVAFGFYTQHQLHAATTYTTGSGLVDDGTFGLTSTSYFARDTWTPSLKFTTLADLWFQHSVDTNATNFDPRLSLIFRPNANDIVRVTGGRAYSEPDPFIVLSTKAQIGAPQSLNPLCTAGTLNSVGSISNRNLNPETATDEEISYGHRFNPTTVVQIDAYNADEQNAILSGNLPLSTFPQYVGQLQAPYTEPNGNTVTLEQGFLDRINGQCGGSPTAAVLGWRLNVNAGQARYRGVDLNAQLGLVRNLSLQLDYGKESAQFSGIPLTVLQNNHGLINDTQIGGVPMDKGTASLVYSTPAGFRALIEGDYIGTNNPLNRGAYWYANAGISKTTGPVTVSLGMQNLFNSVAQQWGFIGYGVFRPENQFGHDQNAIDQGTEEFGLPYRQAFFTITFKT